MFLNLSYFVLQNERLSLRNRIEKKTAYSQELEEQVMNIIDTLGLSAWSSCYFYHRFLHRPSIFSVYVWKYVGLQNLIQRNEHLYSSGNAPSGGVALPFILVQVNFTNSFLWSLIDPQANLRTMNTKPSFHPICSIIVWLLLYLCTRLVLMQQ